MTLDDLELLEVRIFSEFRVISQIWATTTASRIISDRVVAHCTIQRCIDYVDIAGRASAMGLHYYEYSGRKWPFLNL